MSDNPVDDAIKEALIARSREEKARLKAVKKAEDLLREFHNLLDVSGTRGAFEMESRFEGEKVVVSIRGEDLRTFSVGGDGRIKCRRMGPEGSRVDDVGVYIDGMLNELKRMVPLVSDEVLVSYVGKDQLNT